MNIALILAAGVGQRMRNAGLPKQFLKLLGKPIIIYTLEKFEESADIDQIVIVCHGSYIEYMERLLRFYQMKKVRKIIIGGIDRQSSLHKGLETIESLGADLDDIVVVHDGVRPMLSLTTIKENVRIAKQYGCAMTVHPVTESVIITDSDQVGIADFKNRTNTYSLTAPQSFRLRELRKAYEGNRELEYKGMPLLDAAMVYANYGGEVHLVKEQNSNIKITTPEDFYYLKAILDLEENKYIFGL
jgi:2-C-methyl-D-erythritol 4-phosphate cytidylyltransferase